MLNPYKTKQIWQKFSIVFLASLVLFFIDQTTKTWAITHLNLLERTPLYSGVDFYLSYNKGLVLGLLAQYGPNTTLSIYLMWLMLSLYALYQLAIYAETAGEDSLLLYIAITLILGGALGNLYDRVYLGAVIDFIQLYVGVLHTHFFNLADVFISLGFVIILGCLGKQSIYD